MFHGQRERARIGINAQLLALGENYRSAGISNYIYHLLTHLAAGSDFSYTVWSGERGVRMAGMEWRVTPLPTRRPPVRIVWEQLLQPYAVARVRPDVLHGLAFVLPLWLGARGVVTVYDLSFLHMPETFQPLNRLYLKTMTGLSARRAARVCAIAEHGKLDIMRRLGVSSEKIAVVYPGLDPRFLTPPSQEEVRAFRSRRGLPERYVLYLGTLEPRKNVPALARAFDRVRDQFEDVDLIIAGGKGWGFDAIFAEIERLRLGPRVHLPGFVAAEELPLWYAGAEVFVYPSRYEGFGLPPLEAMACGTPVITTDVASLSEVVGDAGCLVPPDNEEALAGAMAELLRDPAERERREALGLRQAERFRWQTSAAAQIDVYRRVLEETHD
jgi:glycosyltransferase involved in cell wall biosynthesis